MQRNGLVGRVLVGLALTVAASSGMALSMSIPYGWYAEGNLGSTNLYNKSYPGSESTSGIGGNVNVGYKFMPYVGVEAGYSEYASTKIDDSAGVQAAKDRHTSYDLAVKGILPVMQTGLEAFAKLGAAHVKSDMKIENQAAATSLGLTENSHNTINVYYGGGLQYYFIPEIAVVAQWQRANGNGATGTMDLLTGGISILVD